MGAGATAAVPDRPNAEAVGVAGAARSDRPPTSRAARRLGLSPWASGSLDLAAGTPARRRRRVPGDARAAPAATGARAGGGGGRAARRGEGGTARRRGGGGGACRRWAPRRAPARGAGRPDTARGRGASPRRARVLEQGDREAARDLPEDRVEPRRAHLREDRR